MILYIENPKYSIKKLLELINKINTQKSVAFLYANNELSEREIKEIQFMVASKRIKCLGINLTKEIIKNLYVENCKSLMKAIEEDTNKWKDSPYS